MTEVDPFIDEIEETDYSDAIDGLEYTTLDEWVRPKYKVGRPTRYREWFCPMLIDHMTRGYSFESFGSRVLVCKDTLYQWVKDYKEFSYSKKVATEMSRTEWESMGLTGTVGGYGKSFSAPAWIFNMKNRFGWADKTEVQGDIQNTFTLNYQLGTTKAKNE